MTIGFKSLPDPPNKTNDANIILPASNQYIVVLPKLFALDFGVVLVTLLVLIITGECFAMNVKELKVENKSEVRLFPFWSVIVEVYVSGSVNSENSYIQSRT